MSECLSRRTLLAAGIGAAAMTALDPRSIRAQSPARNPMRGAFSMGFLASLEKAYEFLDSMMDAYASGRTVRLVQSYSDQAFLVNGASPKVRPTPWRSLMTMR